MQCVLFILVIHSRGFASVPIKVAMMPPRKMPSIKDPMAVLNNWPLGAGLFHCCRMASFYTLRHSDSSSFMLRPPDPDLGCDCWRRASLGRDVQGDADAYDHSRHPPHHWGSSADFGEPPVK